MREAHTRSTRKMWGLDEGTMFRLVAALGACLQEKKHWLDQKSKVP